MYWFARKLGIEIQGKDCHLGNEVDIDHGTLGMEARPSTRFEHRQEVEMV